MQIRVDKLRANLALLQTATPKKATLPIIQNVLVKDGMITATDLESRVSILLEEANGAAFLIPLRSVQEVLKYVPGDEMLTVEPKDKKLDLSWGGGSASFENKAEREYPDLELKDLNAEGMLDGDVLIKALVDALPYTSTDGARPTLGGVTVYLGNVLQIAGADGFRLSFQAVNLSYPVKKTIIIPAATIGILEYLWRKEPARVGLANDLVSQITAKRQLKLSLYDDNVMEIKFGEITLSSKLITGTPPDHLALLNNFQEPVKVGFMGPELHNAVRRLQGIAKDGTGIVRLLWTETQMTVSARSEELGEVKAVFPVESGSNPGRVALNVRYLLDYLQDKDGLITLGKTEGSAPALLHYGARPIVAIMPMFVQWGDEKPATAEPQAESTESEPEATEENPEPETAEENPEETKEKSSSELATAEIAAATTPEEKPEASGKAKKTSKSRGRRKKA